MILLIYHLNGLPAEQPVQQEAAACLGHLTHDVSNDSKRCRARPSHTAQQRLPAEHLLLEAALGEGQHSHKVLVDSLKHLLVLRNLPQPTSWFGGCTASRK